MKFDNYIGFRHRKIKEKSDKPARDLITNDYFDWLLVDENEFKLIKEKSVKEGTELYQKLVENNFIIDSDDIQNLVRRKNQHLCNVMTGPSLHIVVLTKRCNQKCVYCHATSKSCNDKDKYDLSKENAKKFTEIIMGSPSDNITIEFQGGEPLLNFGILKYIHQYSLELNKDRKKKLDHTIVTNLEAMDNEKFDYIIKNNISVCTSIDGPKHLHDKNRPSINIESSYDKAKYWFERFKKKEVVIGALVTISKESLKYHLEIVDEYFNLGYNHIHLRELNYLGKAIGIWKNIGYTAEEFIEFWKKAMDYIISLNLKGTFFSERTCCFMLDKIINKHEPLYLDMMSPCGAIIGQIAYNYNGKIFTCDEARTIDEDIFQIGDKDSKSIKEIMSKEKSLQIISSTISDSYYCNYCAYKPYCGICPVCNYIEKGNLISDVLRTGRCKVLMAQFDYLFEKLADPKIRPTLESWVNRNIYKDKKVFF